MANYGFVYVLGNPSMPGVYKVGMTNRPPSHRVDELTGATAAPEPFKLLLYGEVDCAFEAEVGIHRDLEEFRTSHKREFFRCDFSKIVDLMREYICDVCMTQNGNDELLSLRLMMDYANATTDEERITAIENARQHMCVRIHHIDGKNHFPSGLLSALWLPGALVHMRGTYIGRDPNKSFWSAPSEPDDFGDIPDGQD